MPPTGDRITKRKDGLLFLYAARTPDGQRRKYAYGRKYRVPNYSLKPRHYDTEEFAERWDRVLSGLAWCGAPRKGIEPGRGSLALLLSLTPPATRNLGTRAWRPPT